MASVVDISDDEVEYLSPKSVSDRFAGEDLCDRACIERRNGMSSVPLDEYNNGFIDHCLNRDNNSDNKDYEIDSMLSSVLDKTFNIDSDQSDDYQSDNESIVEIIEDQSMANWSPNVFLAPNRDQRECNEYYECDYTIDFNEYLDQFLKYSEITAPDAYESIQKSFGLFQTFKDRLKHLKCQNAKLELNLWPIILKGFSTCCVSVPKTGKTNSYLIPLMNWFDSKEGLRDRTKEEEENNGKDMKWGAIVLCGSTRQTYEIARMAKQWRDPDLKYQTVRIVSLNSSNEDKQMNPIVNGWDILVSTPGPLLRAIERNIIDCSGIRCLIIDDADDVLALHYNSILQIYLTFAKIRNSDNKTQLEEKSSKQKSMAFQTIVMAQKWSKGVQWFAKEVQHMPVVVFGSYYEVSIAFGIDCEFDIISIESEREKTILKLLKKAFDKRLTRIAVIFRNIEEIKYFIKMRKKLKELPELEALIVTHETLHFELEKYSNAWKRPNSVLFITDYAIKTVPGFKSCDCIIHYKLPPDFDVFGDRFLLMKNNLKSYKIKRLIGNQENSKQLLNNVVVSHEDMEQIPHLIAYLKRLYPGLRPTQLEDLCQYERRKLCINFSQFGNCFLKSFKCFERHYFNKTDRRDPRVPKNGQIKIVVTYVLGSNQFFFRLNEFRGESESSGEWKKMVVTYDEIREELNSLRNTEFNTIAKLSNNEIYGIAFRGQVFRVRLTTIFGYEELLHYEEYDENDKSQKIELFCIDYGHKVRSRSRQLFRLPDHLKSLPPLAFRAYLYGIKPIDNEIEWDFTSTQKLYELVDNYRVIQTTAWILKQINGVFWLNRLSVQKKLKSAKLKLESNPIEYLIEHKLVERNDRKIPIFNTDYNKIVNIWQNNRLTQNSYNTYLVDDSTLVVVSDFVSVEEFYLVHESRVKRLQQLEDKWTASLKSLIPLTEVTEQQICFYQYFDAVYQESCLNRAKVVKIDDEVVDLFLVDHGETVTKVPKKSLLQIKQSDIKELPFQAIKVALFGFKPLKAIPFDQICELTRNSDDKYLLTIAQKVNENTVRLFVAEDEKETKFTALSKLLVDLDYGQYIDGEEDNELEVIVRRHVEEEEEEIPEYIEQIEEEMKDKICQEFLLKMCGLNEYEDIDQKREVENRPKESLMAKTLRRLKALKVKAIENQNIDSDDSDTEWQAKSGQTIDYSPEDFNYSYDPNAEVANYDPEDDKDSIHSDEDGILEEEELT